MTVRHQEVMMFNDPYGIGSVVLFGIIVLLLIGSAAGAIIGWWLRGRFAEWELGREIDKHL